MAAVATSAYGSCIPANFLHSPPKITNQISSPPPLYISTNPSHVNPSHLQHLYALCNHSCHRFPNLDSDGRVELIDVGKLRTALSNISAVVSVFTKPELANDLSSTAETGTRSMAIGGNWIQRVMPVTPDNGKLVGFGHAVSDLGLIASIYDVMVLKETNVQLTSIREELFSFYRLHRGTILPSITCRMLTGKGVYDISALCSDKEGLFFKACGFGEDILGSTTMMYAGTSSCPDAHQIAIYAGRKLVLSPPLRQ